MSPTDPRSAYPEFYNNPIIGAIAGIPRWTVSDNEKIPINMRELMTSGRIWGAHEISEQCLVSLPDLTDALPSASNNAFYLRSQTDGVLVLDIEPKCPPEVARELLALPNLYEELSMSGNGYHLVMPMPANFWDYPIATGKLVLKETHGWYEILLDHWVTFTRKPIPEGRRVDKNFEPGAWEQLYDSLAKNAVEAPTVDFNLDDTRPEIPRREQILDLMTRVAVTKGIDDYHGDASRYEFGTLAVLFNRLKTILIAIREAEPDFDYNESAIAWLLFEAATQILPPRDKHMETRNGMPLLLNTAVALVARRLGDQQAEDAKG